MADSFRFVQKMEFTERLYIAIWKSSRSPKRWRYLWTQMAFALAILALSFLSVYTISLGIAVACFFAWLGFIGFVSPPMLKRRFREQKVLHYPLTFIVSGRQISLEGKHIQTAVDWTFLATWQVVGNWIVLTPYGAPQAYFDIEELKKAGVFDNVLTLARKHGREFA